MTEYTFVVEGKPRTKARPRMTRRGRTYTPKATLEAEALVLAAYDGPVFDGPLEVEMDFHYDKTVIRLADFDWRSKLTGDVDNYVKLVLDALQGDEGAFLNDRLVSRIVATKHHPAD